MSKSKNTTGRFRESVSYQAILLGGSTLLATTLLSFGNIATKDAIELRQKEDLIASISQVVEPQLYDNQLLESVLMIPEPGGNERLVYQATKDGSVTAVVYEVSDNNGYSGAIRSILGVAPTGRVLGVRVLSHKETPGLGDKIEAEKSGWILSFNGLSLEDPPRSEWAVKKDGGYFDQFTGATITPRAVVRSVRSGLEFFDAHKRELLDAASEKTAIEGETTRLNPGKNDAESIMTEAGAVR